MARKIFLLCFCFLSVFPYGLQAEDVKANPGLEQAAHEIERALLSPFCPGRSLKDCPSSGADSLKQEIRELLRSGKNKDEIIATLLERYGEQVRAVPKAEGFGIMAWVAPIAFLVIGLLVILTVFRSPRGETQESDELPEDLKERIDSELQDRS